MSSDYFRGLVSDDENDQSATGDAFDTLHYVAGKRLAAGRLTVIDATNVQQDARKPLVALARKYHVLPVAIVLDIPERICEDRNRERPDRQFGPHVLRRQRLDLKRSIKGLGREGFRHVWVLKPEDVEGVEITREPLWNNKKDVHGPFDIIGDVHGCGDELESLLATLGYEVVERREGAGLDAGPVYRHPDGRRPCSSATWSTAVRASSTRCGSSGTWSMRARGWCVMGNHEQKLLRALQGRNVQVTHGLADSLGEIEALPADDRPAFVEALKSWLDGLISHYVFDDGKLVVAHAGLKAEMQGRGLRRRPRVRAVRRHDRRDRRVRAAGPAELGGRLPRQGDGRLRPHAGPRARVAEQHDRCRHRLRVRRQADRAALPGTRVRVGPRAADLLRAGSPVPGARGPCAAAHGPAAERRHARPGRRHRQAPGRDAPRGQGHDPRGERGRGDRGDEPIRGRPALADLPAPDDVAERNEPGAGASRAPCRRLRLLPHERRAEGRGRGEAHGLAGGARRVPRRGRRQEAVRHHRRQHRHRSTRGPGAGSSTRTSRSRSSAASAPRWTRPGPGTSWPPTGCSSTPSSCPGRPRRRS